MKKIVVALMFGVALLWADNTLVLEEKCEANDAEACFKLGKEDKACDLGLAEACMETRNYNKACDLGNVEGCERILDSMDSKSKETRELYEKYCLNDMVVSICVKGIKEYETFYQDFLPVYNAGKFTLKYMEILSKDCDEGNTRTCVFLGESYLDGYTRNSSGARDIAVGKDTAKAREFYQKACDFGDTKTCKKYELTQDTNKLKTILEKACSSGNQNACPRLGELYFEEGKNAGKDAAKAKELYQKSCDLNSADGCYKIAVYYNVGRGVSQDINKAKELYKKACELKNESACSNFERLSK